MHEIGRRYRAAVTHSHTNREAADDATLREGITELAGRVAGGNTIWLGCDSAAASPRLPARGATGTRSHARS